MLNNNYFKLLGALNNISNTCIISDSNEPTYITGINKSIIARIDNSKFDIGEFESFGVKSLSQLLNLNSTMQGSGDLEYKLNEGIFEFTTSSMNFKYYVFNKEILSDFKVNPTSLSNIEAVPTMAKFELSKSIISQILKISSIFELNDVIFSAGKDTNTISVVATTLQKNNTIANSTKNVLDIHIPGIMFDEDESFILETSSLKKIPVSNYECIIHYVKDKGRKSMKLVSQEVEGLDIFVAPKHIKK